MNDYDDGYFECELGHVHDKTGLAGPLHEGAPCPNDPDSPNAYPDEDAETPLERMQREERSGLAGYHVTSTAGKGN